ncbi:MAG: dihydrodipicolinate reductase C-terminal domain-containing protein, partial [Planctomycetaceae bacterium]
AVTGPNLRPRTEMLRGVPPQVGVWGSVRATSRDCYARGALAAASFLAGCAPGRYSMNDVLGIG